jgi:hypothetical protein
MTDIRSLEQTLLDNLPWNKARIKFVARFLLALYAMRTVNLSILATALSGHAKDESNYKRIRRFMREFEMPYTQPALLVVKTLGVPGPYTLVLDRTNWKVGATDVVGLWQASVKELKLKKHGYPPKSVFRRGLDILCRLVTNFERFDVAVWRKVVKLFVL